MRSLVNYCFDVQRPRVEHVRSRIMMIAVREKLWMSKEDKKMLQLMLPKQLDVYLTKVSKRARALTKEHRVLPSALDDVGKKGGSASDTFEAEIDEEGFVVERGGAEGEEEQESDGSNDKQEAAGGNNADSLGFT
ncbi:unnamed protein product, partial [Mesorhabditis belari]|uniref:Uncharacterized protein n=1 Tax=Mesorhabditis belari TaxID=2138241 RepID=A0AAF3F1Q6_9BILA